MTRLLKPALVLLAPMTFLAACGVKGDLATPPPVFGSSAQTADTPDDADTDTVGPDEDPFFGPEFEDDFRDDD